MSENLQGWVDFGDGDPDPRPSPCPNCHARERGYYDDPQTCSYCGKVFNNTERDKSRMERLAKQDHSGFIESPSEAARFDWDGEKYTLRPTAKNVAQAIDFIHSYNPEWYDAPKEAIMLITYKTAKHLPRRRRRKVERQRRKRAMLEAQAKFFKL